jgi:hypothetical protein
VKPTDTRKPDVKVTSEANKAKAPESKEDSGNQKKTDKTDKAEPLASPGQAAPTDQKKGD